MCGIPSSLDQNRVCSSSCLSVCSPPPLISLSRYESSNVSKVILDNVLFKNLKYGTACLGSGPLFNMRYDYEGGIGYAQVLIYSKHLCKARGLLFRLWVFPVLSKQPQTRPMFYSGLLFQQNHREGLECEKGLCYVVSFCFKSENKSPNVSLQAFSALFLSDLTPTSLVSATYCQNASRYQRSPGSGAFLEGSCAICDSVCQIT